MSEQRARSHSELFALCTWHLDHHLSNVKERTNEVFPKVISELCRHLLFRLQINYLECWLLKDSVYVLHQVVKRLISSQ